jgi:hypothetical protein
VHPLQAPLRREGAGQQATPHIPSWHVKAADGARLEVGRERLVQRLYEIGHNVEAPVFVILA